MSTQETWADWLASINYGVDYRTSIDPPIELADLAAAYVRLTGDENAETWAWCIETETGPWRGSGRCQTTPRRIAQRGHGNTCVIANAPSASEETP